MITPREIIAQAWTITTKEHSLRRWGFTSALFETLRSTELFLYQAYYLYWYFKGISVGWLSVEVLFFEKLPFWLFLLITVLIGVLLILELFVPTLCTGAIIGLAAKSYRKEEVKGGLILALTNFFPILETHGLFVLSSFGIVFAIWSFILRYGGDPGIKSFAMVLLLILWIIATVFRFFASFTEEGIVIRKMGVFQAIGKSFKLIVSYLSHVMFLVLLLLVISLRIFINAVMIFLLPGIAIGIGFLFALFLPHVLSYTIGACIALLLLFVVSYFVAYLHVFRQTVWTLTYLELSARKELDVIVAAGEASGTTDA